MKTSPVFHLCQRTFLFASVWLLATPALAAPSIGELRTQIKRGLIEHKALSGAVAMIRDQVALQPPPPGRGAIVSRQFQALGPDAALPLYDLLDGKTLMTLSPRARVTVKVAALDALTHLRDARGTALYQKIFDEDEDLDVARAAGEALGTLESTEGMQFLLDRAIAGHPKEPAAFSGLAFCRRGEVAHRFAARLSEQPDARLVRAIAQRAAFWGSSWAWQALGTEREAEGLAGRQAIADALVTLLPSYQGDARTAIINALVAIEHPATKAAVARLRTSAKPELARSLDQLSARLK